MVFLSDFGDSGKGGALGWYGWFSVLLGWHFYAANQNDGLI
jgi:hypothetical protein